MIMYFDSEYPRCIRLAALLFPDCSCAMWMAAFARKFGTLLNGFAVGAAILAVLPRHAATRWMAAFVFTLVVHG
jgi:hypothetical protein